MSLRSLTFQLSYNPDNCPDIVKHLYEPALSQAIRYDRTTFGFSPTGLVNAAIGIAGLIRNKGKIQLVCDQSLDHDIVQAVIEGRLQAAEALRQSITPESLGNIDPEDIQSKEYLDLISWLVKNDLIEIKVAIQHGFIFHPKIGILTDSEGNRVAFNGSANESGAGWEGNYEHLDVFCSWEDLKWVADKEEQFQRLWNNESQRAIVIPIPDDYQEYLKQIAPTENPLDPKKPDPVTPDERDALWQRIHEALANDPASTAATVATEMWPHQENFRRQRATVPGPDRILIADEVGLGKTIQAGILLKTRMNQGKVKRLLIMTPRSARLQWQQELRHKFNINIPIMERSGGQITLFHSDGTEELSPGQAWEVPHCIVSYHWVLRNRETFLKEAEQYDIVIVDEAHHARFQEVNDPRRRRPNQFLAFLRRLSTMTRDLILMTATPMQLNDAELWALLNLLEPQGWDDTAFKLFYDESIELTPAHWRNLRDLYRDKAPRPNAQVDNVERLVWQDNEQLVDTLLNEESMKASAEFMRRTAPPKRNLSRHTRQLLQQYQQAGLIKMTVPGRRVRDRAITMTPDERVLYDEINDLVNQCYGNKPGLNQTAVGFIMTVYRKRMGSSAHSYARSIQNHLDRRMNDAEEWQLISEGPDNTTDMEDPDYILPGTDLTSQQQQMLLDTKGRAEKLAPSDTKYQVLLQQMSMLQKENHKKIIIFTQFQDTLDYLADRLINGSRRSVTCISGQDTRTSGTTREERIRQLRDAEEGILICTETAAESLNLQFCTAVINYDMPWNPMTVEQRIGRIDRIGQQRKTVDVINLFYEKSAEYDAYQVMARRMKDIENNVGPYRPIMQPNIERIIADAHRTGASQDDIEKELEGLTSAVTLNLNLLNTEIEQSETPEPVISMEDLTQILNTPDLLPDGWTAVPCGWNERGQANHWRLWNPEGQNWTVTTDREAHAYAPDRLQWWGPGSDSFPI